MKQTIERAWISSEDAMDAPEELTIEFIHPETQGGNHDE